MRGAAERTILAGGVLVLRAFARAGLAAQSEVVLEDGRALADAGDPQLVLATVHQRARDGRVRLRERQAARRRGDLRGAQHRLDQGSADAVELLQALARHGGAPHQPAHVDLEDLRGLVLVALHGVAPGDPVEAARRSPQRLAIGALGQRGDDGEHHVAVLLVQADQGVGAQLLGEGLLQEARGLGVVLLVLDELLQERVAHEPLVGVRGVGRQHAGLEEGAVLVRALGALELLGPALLVELRLLLLLLLVGVALVRVDEHPGHRDHADQRLRGERPCRGVLLAVAREVQHLLGRLQPGELGLAQALRQGQRVVAQDGLGDVGRGRGARDVHRASSEAMRRRRARASLQRRQAPWQSPVNAR